ncbi:hypothetical protein V6N13_083593 [Hibiscus sabdariffa]|uniref:ERCC4 domain-containing protein n=1 Tax=Hibiscus sabdariffa TaxID=183260 RepID=A0ABR2SZA2_9ROSI
MSDPIILSDGDDPNTPRPSISKKPRTEHLPLVLILDDDPTPQKPSLGPAFTSGSTPSFVAETPMSEPSVARCSNVAPSIVALDPQLGDAKLSGISRLICLESDNDSDTSSKRNNDQENGSKGFDIDESEDLEWRSRFFDYESHLGSSNLIHMCEEDQPLYEQDDGDPLILEQEKLQKAALKAEAAEFKKLQKERQKWEKGKFALKSIVAEIDTKVVELGSIGGHLLSRFADKGLTYRITSNPIEKSIVWTMTVPEDISQLSPEGLEIQYVLIVYEAAEFCDLVTSDALLDHVSRVQSKYPSYTVCYLTNRLTAYINKRENEQYKNPANDSGWRRPPIEEALAKLTAYYARIHSRQCADESELAEHVVGLTCSLASCQFRKKLTRLSVSANGSLIPKDSIDKNLIKGNLWLKALLAIPKVQPRFALAIGKKYPTMRSLLRVYMDPSTSVHEKEFLLKDLVVEGLLGNDRRLGEVCSKRVYRVLMAQSGSIKTDDIEDGADFFAH